MKINKFVRRDRRKKSIRSKIYGSEEKPRITIYKSEKHIYSQIINDRKGITLCCASTVDKEFEDRKGKNLANMKAAEKVGELLAKRAKEKEIKKVVFDRNGYKYHGCVKALAEALRKGGLEF